MSIPKDETVKIINLSWLVIFLYVCTSFSGTGSVKKLLVSRSCSCSSVLLNNARNGVSCISKANCWIFSYKKYKTVGFYYFFYIQNFRITKANCRILETGSHRLPLEFLSLADELHQKSGSFQVMPESLPCFQLFFQRCMLLLAIFLHHMQVLTQRTSKHSVDSYFF